MQPIDPTWVFAFAALLNSVGTIIGSFRGSTGSVAAPDPPTDRCLGRVHQSRRFGGLRTRATQGSSDGVSEVILLTFAQFEREMLAARIRHKIRARRQAGRWVGEAAPFGYDLVNSKLVVD